MSRVDTTEEEAAAGLEALFGKQPTEHLRPTNEKLVNLTKTKLIDLLTMKFAEINSLEQKIQSLEESLHTAGANYRKLFSNFDELRKIEHNLRDEVNITDREVDSLKEESKHRGKALEEAMENACALNTKLKAAYTVIHNLTEDYP